jgi:hypothetical protein
LLALSRTALPLDDGRILIVNLSKDRIGDDACHLLGSLVVTALQQAAMSRADMAEPSRRDFWQYIDEFQNFATESFATILSEGAQVSTRLGAFPNAWEATFGQAQRLGREAGHNKRGSVGQIASDAK